MGFAPKDEADKDSQVRCPHETSFIASFIKHIGKTLNKVCDCSGLSESSLVTHEIGFVTQRIRFTYRISVTLTLSIKSAMA